MYLDKAIQTAKWLTMLIDVPKLTPLNPTVYNQQLYSHGRIAQINAVNRLSRFFVSFHRQIRTQFQSYGYPLTQSWVSRNSHNTTPPG